MLSPSLWQRPRDITATSIPGKPVKGHKFSNLYAHTVARVTDHAAEIPGVQWVRNNYSRRQAFNADNSLLAFSTSNGFWHLYDAHSFAHVRQLAGPAGDDAEVQWDPLDPNTLYYGELNGGTKIFKMDVRTGASTVQYDFGNDIRALFPNAVHCWSGAEGSPSKDGRLWGYKAEDNGFGILGLFVMDIVAKQIVWHRPETIRPDNTSVTPSGRWFVWDHGQSGGTFACNIQTNEVKQLHHGLEHADLGILPNGHDFYVAIDYQTDNGDVFVTDIETMTKKVLFGAYHNPWLQNEYALHFSAKGFKKPGYILITGIPSDAQHPCAQLIVANAVTGQLYGLGQDFSTRTDYFDEAHAVCNREFTGYAYNDNYGTPLNLDVYYGQIPPLP